MRFMTKGPVITQTRSVPTSPGILRYLKRNSPRSPKRIMSATLKAVLFCFLSCRELPKGKRRLRDSSLC